MFNTSKCREFYFLVITKNVDYQIIFNSENIGLKEVSERLFPKGLLYNVDGDLLKVVFF